MYFNKDTKMESPDFYDLSLPYFYRHRSFMKTCKEIKYGLVRLITVDLTVSLVKYDRIPGSYIRGACVP